MTHDLTEARRLAQAVLARTPPSYRTYAEEMLSLAFLALDEQATVLMREDIQTLLNDLDDAPQKALGGAQSLWSRAAEAIRSLARENFALDANQCDKPISYENGDRGCEYQERAERAEALLLECEQYIELCNQQGRILRERIRAHLEGKDG